MAKNPGKASTVGKAASRPDQMKVFAWVLALLSVVLFFPTVLLLVVGMAPTIVAAISDRHTAKFTTRTVGYLNLCGCLPYAIDLWSSSHTIAAAAVILSEPVSWLAMYGAAAVGWVIHFMVPPFAATYLAVNAEMKEKSLKNRQRELVDEWGPQLRERVTGSDAEEETEGGAAVVGEKE